MISRKLKIGSGLTLVVIGILTIISVFLLSLGLFFNMLIMEVLSIMQWIGIFMFIFLLFLLLTIYCNKKFKAVFLNISIAFLILGSLDTMKLLWPEFDLRESISGLVKKNNETVNISKGSFASNQQSTRPKFYSKKLSLFSPFDVKVHYENEKEYFTPSETLGYAPFKNRRTRTFSTYKGLRLFDVHYTIDENGQRITPAPIKQESPQSLLFFGGSATFGYGLEDTETLPYQVGLKTNFKYKIYNFAFIGYGTHQMVSALEHNVVEHIVKVPPKHVIYFAISDHMNRIINKKDWGFHDPKYELNEDGEVIYCGHFDDDIPPIFNTWLKSFHKVIARSFIIQSLRKSKSRKDTITRAQLDLFIAMVKKAKDLVKQKYPECEFHLIYSDKGTQSPIEVKLKSMLKETDIDYHFVTNIIPDYNTAFANYAIKHPYENNLNPFAQNIISDYIAKKILKEKSEFSRSLTSK